MATDTVSDVVRDLDAIDRLLATKDAKKVRIACEKLSRVHAILPVLPLDASTLGPRARMRALTSAVSDILAGYRRSTLSSRIETVLARHPDLTFDEIAAHVRWAVEDEEEARVAFLHALGKAVVLSWPDIPREDSVRSSLAALRIAGRIERRWRLFSSTTWSIARNVLRGAAPEAISAA